MSLLPPFNPGIPSYFDLPLRGELEELSSTEIVARTLLSMHRQKISGSSYEIKSVSSISPADVDLTVTRIQGVFTRSLAKCIHPSRTESLALLLLHLEEGFPSKSIVGELRKLKDEDFFFLCNSVSPGDPRKGYQAIKNDPFLLLRIKNREGKTPIEILLEKHICLGIITHLQALKSKSLSEIKASPYFSLLCNFVRWEDGGKENPHFGSADYGETTICAKPEDLFSGSPSRIDRLCLSLDEGVLSDRDRDAFHETDCLIGSFANADKDVYAKIAKAMPDNFTLLEITQIKDEKLKIEVVKRFAAIRERDIARDIHRFGITSEIARIEIAKLMAAQARFNISQDIKNFGITDQEALIEIAKIAAAYCGSGVSRDIQAYGITSEVALVEIAKIAAAQSGGEVSFHIRKYGITSQAALIEIAKIAAQHDGAVSYHIRNYGITSQVALIEIAKQAATSTRRGIAEFIKEFGITDQVALIEIAKLTAAKNGWELSMYIGNFEITDQGALIEILTIAAAQNQEKTSELSLKYGITSVWEIKNAIRPGCLGGKALIENASLEATYTAILGYRNAAIKLNLAGEFLSGLDNEVYRNRYASLLLNERGESVAHLRLPMVFVAKFMESSVCPEAVAIREKFLEYRPTWRDMRSNLLSSALNTLHSLDKVSVLSPKQKLQLLAQIAAISTDAASLKLNLQKTAVLLATNYFLIGSEKLLGKLTQAEFSEQFPAIFIAHITGKLFEGLAVEPDFIERYLSLTFAQREPFALEQYAARIEDPRVKKETQRFLFSIVNGDFEKKRYEPGENPHLRELASYRLPGETFTLWQRWQDLSSSLPSAGASAGAGAMTEASAGAGVSLTSYATAVVAAPSFFNWLKEKLLTDRHVEKLEEKLPILAAFLHSPETVDISDRDMDPIEKACSLLLKKGSIEDQLGVLRDLKALVEKDERFKISEWRHDIESMIAQLQSKEAAEFNVVITDDWQDLFLCGTEVLGSCQRIDASQYTAKCLLGYCQDGKIQMVALKDPKTGKLLARAVLKLLLKEETDTTGKKIYKPVMFLEKVYPEPVVAAYTKAINACVAARVKDLGLDLYAKNELILKNAASVDKGDAILISLGSPSPFEYEDGMTFDEGAVTTDGIYHIDDAKKVILG